jgi:hypothetical protein
MPPRIGEPDVLDPEDRLANIVGDRTQRQGATGAAFSQFFDPTLSGQQQQVVQDTVKNRIARGLRGRAAEAAGQRIQSSFEASNRLSALGFLEDRFRGQGGLAVGPAEGGGVNLAPPGGFTPGTTTGFQTPGFQALLQEISGLRAFGVAEGSGSFNQLIEQGQAAGGLGGIFQSFGTQEVQDVLNPAAAIERDITGRRGQLQGFVDEATERANALAPGQFGSIVGADRIRLTPEVRGLLGLPDPAEVGGIFQLNTRFDLKQQLADSGFLDKVGGIEGLQVTAEASLDPGKTAQPELGAFLRLSSSSLEGQAQILQRLLPKAATGPQGASISTTPDIDRTLNQLNQLREFQQAVPSPLGQLNLISDLQSQISELNRPFDLQQFTTVNPFTGNPRTDTVKLRRSEAERTAQITQRSDRLGAIEGFRRDLFSPQVPFLT